MNLVILGTGLAIANVAFSRKKQVASYLAALGYVGTQTTLETGYADLGLVASTTAAATMVTYAVSSLMKSYLPNFPLSTNPQLLRSDSVQPMITGKSGASGLSDAVKSPDSATATAQNRSPTAPGRQVAGAVPVRDIRPTALEFKTLYPTVPTEPVQFAAVLKGEGASSTAAAAQDGSLAAPGGPPAAIDPELDQLIAKVYNDHGEVIEGGSIERVANVTTAAMCGVAYERPLVLFAKYFDSPTGVVGDCCFIDDLSDKSSMPQLINEMRCMLQCGRMPVLVLDAFSSLDVLGAVTETFVRYSGMHGARVARFIVPEGELRDECARLWGVGRQRSAVVAVFGEDMISESVSHLVDEADLKDRHLCYEDADSRDCARAHLSDIIYQWVYSVAESYKVGRGIPSPKVRENLIQQVSSDLAGVRDTVMQEIDLQQRARVELGIQKDEFMLRSMSLSPDEIMAIQDPWEDLKLLYEGTKEVIGTAGSYKRNAFLFAAVAVRLGTYVMAATTIFQMFGVVVTQLAAGVPVGLLGKFMATCGSSPSSLAAFAAQLPTLFARLVTNNQLMLLLFGGSTLMSTFKSLQPYPALYKMAMRAIRGLPLGILRWIMNSRSCQTFGINMLMYSNMAISVYTGTSDYGASVNNQMQMEADARALDNYSLRYLLRMARELCDAKKLEAAQDKQEPQAYIKVIAEALGAKARQYSKLTHPDKVSSRIEWEIRKGVEFSNKEELIQRAHQIQSDLTNFNDDFVKGFEDAYEQYKNTIETMAASEDPELSTFTSAPVRVMFDVGNDVLPAQGVEVDPARLKALCDPQHFDEGHAVLVADDYAVLFEPYTDPVITGPTEAASAVNAILAKTESMDPDERLTAVEDTLLTLPERRYDVNTWESYNPLNVAVNKRGDPNTLHSPEYSPSPARRNVLSELDNRRIVKAGGPALAFTDEVPDGTYAQLRDVLHGMVADALHVGGAVVSDSIGTDKLKELLPRQDDLARTEQGVTEAALEELVRCLKLVTAGFIGIRSKINGDAGDENAEPVAQMLGVHTSSVRGVGSGLLAELMFWSRAIEDRAYGGHAQEMRRLAAMTDAHLRAELGVSDPAVPVGIDRVGNIPLAVLACIAARPRDKLHEAAKAAGAAAAVAAYVRDGDNFEQSGMEAVFTAAGMYHTIVYAVEGLGRRPPAAESIVPAYMGEDGRHVCKFIEMVATRFGTQDIVVPLLTSHHDIWRDVWWPLLRPE